MWYNDEADSVEPFHKKNVVTPYMKATCSLLARYKEKGRNSPMNYNCTATEIITLIIIHAEKYRHLHFGN